MDNAPDVPATRVDPRVGPGVVIADPLIADLPVVFPIPVVVPADAVPVRAIAIGVACLPAVVGNAVGDIRGHRDGYFLGSVQPRVITTPERSRRHVYIVALSALDGNASPALAFDAGCDDIISKPSLPAALIAVVRAHFAK